MESAYLRHIPQEDIYLFNTGNAKKAWLCFGCRYIPELKAHRFIVWAPNAQRVSRQLQRLGQRRHADGEDRGRSVGMLCRGH